VTHCRWSKLRIKEFELAFDGLERQAAGVFRLQSHGSSWQAAGMATKSNPSKNPAAVALGRLGGLKGGPARRDRGRKVLPKRRSDGWRNILRPSDGSWGMPMRCFNGAALE